MALIHRHAAVAGQFYPQDSKKLVADINQYLTEDSIQTERPTKNIKAIIVPHAGYIYSAAIAASAYRLLQSRASTITNIILLGPAHRIPVKGIASSSAEFFDTPLGSIQVNRTINHQLEQFEFVTCVDTAHQNEHSLEVQLPFLQTVLTKFTIVPLLVGDCASIHVATLLEFLWAGTETLIVISSDLSHFEHYDVATKIDQNTSHQIIKLRPENIQYEHACGCIAVNGLLKLAKKMNLNASILDVRNSGDTAGDKQRVVGYGSYAFIPK